MYINLNKLKCIVILDFCDYPLLTIDIDTEHNYYINYLYSADTGIEIRLIIPASVNTLEFFNKNIIDLEYIFNTSEKRYIYIIDTHADVIIFSCEISPTIFKIQNYKIKNIKIPL